MSRTLDRVLGKTLPEREDLIHDFREAFLTRWHRRPHYRDRIVKILTDWIEEHASNEALVTLAGLIRELPYREQ